MIVITCDWYGVQDRPHHRSMCQTQQRAYTLYLNVHRRARLLDGDQQLAIVERRNLDARKQVRDDGLEEREVVGQELGDLHKAKLGGKYTAHTFKNPIDENEWQSNIPMLKTCQSPKDTRIACTICYTKLQPATQKIQTEKRTFESRSARMSVMSSVSPGSARFSDPAITNTDFTARMPKS